MRPLTLGLLLLVVVPSLAREQCVSSGNCIMPPGSCAYLGFDRITLGPNHVMNVLFLENSSQCPAFPSLGGSTNVSFAAVGDINLSSDGGSTFEYPAKTMRVPS